ncbi:hypothetical protein, partial [Bradyrhizobium sp. CCBAU 21362]|uniref:hypothetical protein n=1 Tax=Bradyrhizobium sp. CCBAU 21362 TaxID=1325082 RepID=UPI0023057CE7
MKILAEVWSRYKQIDPVISLGSNVWGLWGLSGLSSVLLTSWAWFWNQLGWATIPVGFLGTFIALSVCVFLVGLGRHFWSSSQRHSAEPAANPNGGTDAFGGITLTQSPPSLENSVHVSNMRMTIDTIAVDRASELSMSVFNGSGRVIEFGRATGRITYRVKNGDQFTSEGALPTPSVDPNSARTAVQNEECYLILRQPVPQEIAAALRVRAETMIYFDLTELQVEVCPKADPEAKEKLKLWDGITVSRGYMFGRIKNATVH